MVELVSERAGVTQTPSAVSWSTDLTTRDGYVFHVRPASPADEPALGEFFEHVDKEDLRFRFLSAIHKVGHDQLRALVTVDHEHTENFLAFDPATNRIVATAMLAADDSLTRAEVAIAIRTDFKRRGVSWTLLDHVRPCKGDHDARVDREPRQPSGDRPGTRTRLDRVGLSGRSGFDDAADDSVSLTSRAPRQRSGC